MSRIVEATVTLILVGLILNKAGGFSTAIKAAGGVYVDAVNALKS